MFAAYKNAAETTTENNENPEFLANPSFEDNSKALVRISSSESDDFSDESDNEHTSKAIEYHKLVKPQTVKELFYIDREPKYEYLKLTSLPTRVLPMYRVYRRFAIYYGKKRKFSRYFKEKKKNKKVKNLFDVKESDKAEEMRIHLSKEPNDVDKWIEYINYKEMAQLNEKSDKPKLEIIEKALHFNPTSPVLMDLYLKTIRNVHTIDVVLDTVKTIISKDPYNISYWKHYLSIYTASMTCDVEKGLKEFEKALKVIRKSNDTDLSVLQIFKQCCLFLRQAGLYEQFFAVIHLMLSMNVNESSDFDRIFYTNETQNPHLMEYEELVLLSELPMNELWYRMETIRAICNFLPVKISTSSGNEEMQDPQRYVFNEDICNLVAPLKNIRAYNFDLFVIALKLLKFPIPYYNLTNELFINGDQELDDGMSFLTVLLRTTFCSENFNKMFFGIIKDLNISPNYLSFNVEHEPFLNCILKILEINSNSFSDKQNKLVLILFLRLLRLTVIIDKLKSDTQDQAEYAKYKKQIKSRVKNILKTSKFQNDLNILTEYALIESSLGDSESCDKILSMAMSAASPHDDEINLYQISMEFCEQKLLKNEKEQCVQQLRALAGYYEDPVAYFDTKIEEIRCVECPSEIEDYFLPISNKFNLIKAKIYFQLLTKSKKQALASTLSYINACKDDKSFLKEELYEFYVEIFHLKINDERMNIKTYLDVLARALADFPKNIFIMHTIAGQFSLRWFDVRKLLMKNPTNESIFYLTVACKYRAEQFVDENAKVFKHRIYNTIDGLMGRKIQGISSVLTWRLYLRAAFNYDFTKCKTILYQLLDSYPMIKQLYLDGAKYLPEEHSQLTDLIIEKGLRTHAIVEELEILRTNSIR